MLEDHDYYLEMTPFEKKLNNQPILLNPPQHLVHTPTLLTIHEDLTINNNVV